jgi:hypothetical protein
MSNARTSRPLTLLAMIAVALLVCSAAAAEGPDDFRIKSAESFDKVIDFLVTLDLALFAVVGFFIRNGLAGAPRVRCGQIILLILFTVAASFSLFCGYRARLDLASILASGSFPFQAVQDWYVYQAVLVVGSGVLAAATVALCLLGNDREPAGEDP